MINWLVGKPFLCFPLIQSSRDKAFISPLLLFSSSHTTKRKCSTIPSSSRHNCPISHFCHICPFWNITKHKKASPNCPIISHFCHICPFCNIAKHKKASPNCPISHFCHICPLCNIAKHKKVCLIRNIGHHYPIDHDWSLHLGNELTILQFIV
jgi:hypothetical protein